EACSVRVVGNSTGTKPVSCLSRRRACSCTAGATAGAANDGERIATLSPGYALGGCNSLLMRSESIRGMLQDSALDESSCSTPNPAIDTLLPRAHYGDMTR